MQAVISTLKTARSLGKNVGTSSILRIWILGYFLEFVILKLPSHVLNEILLEFGCELEIMYFICEILREISELE